jgi:hypothetical protein
LRRSQRISKAPAQGRGEEGEDEDEDEEEEVLLTSTQQKALQSQTTPPIQQTQQRQKAQQTQQTPPIQETQQRQKAQQTQQTPPIQETQQRQKAQQTQQTPPIQEIQQTPPIQEIQQSQTVQQTQQTQQSQTAQQTQQLSAQAYPFQQFHQFQLQQSQQSQATASGSQLSATSSSTPIFIDSDDREIIIRSRSRPTTPGVETDILAEFEDFGITRPGSVDDRSLARSRRGTPAIDANIEDIAPSSKPTGTKRRDSTRDIKSIEAMLVKQGRQIRALYELQKSTHEKVTSIQNQLKKTNKNIGLSSKVFTVSNNLITDNNIIIMIVITFRYLTV